MTMETRQLSLNEEPNHARFAEVRKWVESNLTRSPITQDRIEDEPDDALPSPPDSYTVHFSMPLQSWQNARRGMAWMFMLNAGPPSDEEIRAADALALAMFTHEQVEWIIANAHGKADIVVSLYPPRGCWPHEETNNVWVAFRFDDRTDAILFALTF